MTTKRPTEYYELVGRSQVEQWQYDHRKEIDRKLALLFTAFAIPILTSVAIGAIFGG